MGMPVTVDWRRRRGRSTASSRGCAGSTRRSAPTATTARSAASTAASSRSRDAHPRVREVLARCERLRVADRRLLRRACAAGGSTPPGSSRAGRSTARRRCCARARAASASTPAATCSCAAGRGGSGSGTRCGRDALCAALELTDAAVATSGAYERGEHILDPLSGAAGARRAVRHRRRPRPRDRRRLRDRGVRDGRARAGLDRPPARLRGDDDPRRASACSRRGFARGGFPCRVRR